MAAHKHELAEAIEHFGKPVAVVYLLEPRASHLARYGEPTQSVYSGKTGSGYDVPNDEAISKYLDDLISLDGRTPADAGGLGVYKQLGLQDGIALRDALLGFFVKAKLSLFSAPLTASPSTSA